MDLPARRAGQHVEHREDLLPAGEAAGDQEVLHDAEVGGRLHRPTQEETKEEGEGSVQHDGVHVFGFFRHRHESVLGVAHSEHGCRGVQVMTRPPGLRLPPARPRPLSPPQTPPPLSAGSEGMMGKKKININRLYSRELQPTQWLMGKRRTGEGEELTEAPPPHRLTSCLTREKCRLFSRRSSSSSSFPSSSGAPSFKRKVPRLLL